MSPKIIMRIGLSIEQGEGGYRKYLANWIRNWEEDNKQYANYWCHGCSNSQSMSRTNCLWENLKQVRKERGYFIKLVQKCHCVMRI